MFLAQFLLKKKNIFHERFGFNFFPAKRRDMDELIKEGNEFYFIQ